MNRYFKTFALAALALCVVKPASANFLYDVNVTGVHYTFLESSILTSATLVSTFLSNPNGVTSVRLGPDSGDSCAPPGGQAPGPCIATTVPQGAATVTAYSYFAVAFESVGTFTTNDGYPATLTITEVAAVPEPATLALLGLGLFGVAVARRRQ